MDLVKKMMELCSEETQIASSILAKLSQEFGSRATEKQIQFGSSQSNRTSKQAVLIERLVISPLGLMKQRSHLWWETMIVSSFTILERI